MSREIKFRTWDKVNTMMVGHGYLENYKSGFRAFGGDEFELMQYTGRKDKNGVEIYEGDVVSYLDEGRFVIDMDTLGFYRPLDDDSSDMDIIPDRLLERPRNWEVIGNIYENPELSENNNGL